MSHSGPCFGVKFEWGDPGLLTPSASRGCCSPLSAAWNSRRPPRPEAGLVFRVLLQLPFVLAESAPRPGNLTGWGRALGTWRPWAWSLEQPLPPEGVVGVSCLRAGNQTLKLQAFGVLP